MENQVIDYEKLVNCTKKHINLYSQEKATWLLKKRYNPNFVPHGFITYLALVVYDICKGEDGFNRTKFQPSPIIIFQHEAIDFAECLHGDKYASEVKDILESNNIHML